MNKERRLSIKKMNTLKRKRNTLKRKKNTLKRKRNTLKRKNSRRNLKIKNIKGGRPVGLGSKHFHCAAKKYTANPTPTVTEIITGNKDVKTKYVINFTPSNITLLSKTLTTYRDRFIGDFPPGERAFNGHREKEGILNHIKKRMNVPITFVREGFEETFRDFFDDLIAKIANISNIKISFSECKDLYQSLENIQKYVTKDLKTIYRINYIVTEMIRENGAENITSVSPRAQDSVYDATFEFFKANINSNIQAFMRIYEEKLEGLSLSLNKIENCDIRVREINNLFKWMFNVPYNHEFIKRCFYERKHYNPTGYYIHPKSLISEFIKIIQWILSRDNEYI